MNINVLAQELIALEKDIKHRLDNLNRDNKEVYQDSLKQLEVLAEERWELRDQIINQVIGMQYCD
ncbi:hypothetical protein VPBG_00234 [Vibrio phage helene 12B3]|uniref:hypothetical protein n=1 Tax=Vibrio phage helene 12B3 TaxID=573173 RepID=UPI0002C1390B|nr:hypothetical protein VPBG_00234 [Vibrio phage helene 12B3]AGG58006.1 hypothetical protein VPBG_00234 [Vibrio phage helene 12B3]